MARGDPISSLHDRMMRAADNGRGIHFSQNDLDWFVVCGAYAKLLEAVADQRFDEACERILAAGGSLPSSIPPELPKVSDPKEMPKVFSVKSLAQWWGVSGTAIYSLVNAGKLDHFKLGEKLIRITADSVRAYEAEYMSAPTGRGP